MNRNKVTFKRQVDGQWVAFTGVVQDVCLVASPGGPASQYLVKIAPGNVVLVAPGQVTDVEEYRYGVEDLTEPKP